MIPPTPAELERLALLAEECAEVIVIANKIIRHGYDSVNPDNRTAGTNKTQLERELGDVHYALNLMYKNADILRDAVSEWSLDAANRKPRWLHHQGRL